MTKQPSGQNGPVQLYRRFKERAHERSLTVEQIVSNIPKGDKLRNTLYHFWAGKTMAPFYKLIDAFRQVGMRILIDDNGNLHELDFRDKSGGKQKEGDRILLGDRVETGGEFDGLTPIQVKAIRAQVDIFRSANERGGSAKAQGQATAKRTA